MRPPLVPKGWTKMFRDYLDLSGHPRRNELSHTASALANWALGVYRLLRLLGSPRTTPGSI
jgi:hypothetical protein